MLIILYSLDSCITLITDMFIKLFTHHLHITLYHQYQNVFMSMHMFKTCNIIKGSFHSHAVQNATMRVKVCKTNLGGVWLKLMEEWDDNWEEISIGRKE